MTCTTNSLADDVADIAEAGCAAAEVQYGWNDLEESQGEYDFSQIEQDADLCDSYGLMLVPLINLAGGKQAGQTNTITPTWFWSLPGVLEVGGAYVSLDPDLRWPAWWGSVFQSVFSGFVGAFADQFRLDARINYVRIPLGEVATNEPSPYPGALETEYTNDLVGRHGFGRTGVGKLDQNEICPLTRGYRANLTTWFNSLRGTREDLTRGKIVMPAKPFHVPGGNTSGFDSAVIQMYRDARILMLTTGVNERFSSSTRTLMNTYYMGGTRVGGGGVTGLGSGGTGLTGAALRMEMVKQFIGSDTDQWYYPRSMATVFTAGTDFLQYTDAIQFLNMNLIGE